MASPSFPDIFEVMAAASVGNLTSRVPLSDEPQLEDQATRFAIGLNILLDDLERRAADGARELAARQHMTDRLRRLADAAREFSALTYDLPRLLVAVANRLGAAAGGGCTIHLADGDLASLQSAPPRDESAQVTTVPLVLAGKVIGEANLVCAGADSPCDEDDLRIVRSIADHAAVAIGNARLYAAERAARDAAEEATRALRDAQARFARLSESGAIGILVATIDGGVSEINDALLSMLGYTRDEVLSDGFNWRAMTPTDWAGVDARAIQQLADSGIGELREKEYFHKDGSRVPVLMGSAMLESTTGESISFVLDITERKEAQAIIERSRAQRASEAIFSGLLEAAPDAGVVVDRAGTIILVNAQAERLFGYSRAELIGTPHDLLVPERQRAGLGLQHRAWYENPRVVTIGGDVRVHGLRKDGSEFPSELSLGPFQTADGLLVSAAIRDVTERRRAEKAVTRARDHAEAANRELEAFSYSVAHDLRAPLRGMSGFAHLLLETYSDKLDAEGQDWLRDIQRNARKMGELIDGLLSLARVARGEVHASRVDLAEMARDEIAQLAAAEPARTVAVEIQPRLDAEVDPRLARALLQNLLGNAWKFTGTAAAPRIEVGAQEQGGARVFHVRDNGAGFDMAFAKKLFVPFQRLHTRDEFPGTGIGLATVQRIVARHGGRIWAEASVGGGATFYFTLPSAGSEARSNA